MNNMNSIAIITARGGSKRIPRKNIRDFCGKPIIAYSIEAALKSGVFDEVMVSTDDEEIAEIAKKYGATVPFMRSEATANDFATTADVLEEVINTYAERGIKFDSFCCIYPTAPFIKGEQLKKAYDEFKASNANSLVPMVSFSFPPLRGFVVKDGFVSYKWPEYEKARSQDLETIYHDAGQFYFSKTESLLSSHSLITKETVPFILEELEVQDIDTEMDWKIAELKYKILNE